MPQSMSFNNISSLKKNYPPNPYNSLKVALSSNQNSKPSFATSSSSSSSSLNSEASSSNLEISQSIQEEEKANTMLIESETIYNSSSGKDSRNSISPKPIIIPKNKHKKRKNSTHSSKVLTPKTPNSASKTKPAILIIRADSEYPMDPVDRNISNIYYKEEPIITKSKDIKTSEFPPIIKHPIITEINENKRIQESSISLEEGTEEHTQNIDINNIPESMQPKLKFKTGKKGKEPTRNIIQFLKRNESSSDIGAPNPIELKSPKFGGGDLRDMEKDKGDQISRVFTRVNRGEGDNSDIDDINIFNQTPHELVSIDYELGGGAGKIY